MNTKMNKKIRVKMSTRTFLRSTLSAYALLSLLPISAASGQSHLSRLPSPFRKAMDRSMSVMDQAMMAAPMTGNPDHDFSSMMIPHHRGAVAMARVELRYGTDPVLRRLAQEIIVTQQQEVVVMQRQIAAKAAGHSTQAAAGPTGPAGPRAFTVGLMAAPLQRVPQRPTGGLTVVSPRDRVYSADQTSNTVSVIEPATNSLLGVIRLGEPVPMAIQPLYKGALLVHGLGFSPDHKTLAVISIGSNSVTLINTATNAVKGTIYVGRAPHEGFFTPSGRELWVAVRGEDYVSVIDPVRLKEVRRVRTANGPGMIIFSPDGHYAFVPSSFTPELDVVDTHSYRVVARVPQVSPFSPNLAVSPDGAQVWFTLKDTGKTQIISARPPFQPMATLDTGPITNHVNMVDNAHGHFAYVTVGGLDEVKVFSRQVPFPLVATIPTGALPHGLWPSGDGTRVYIGLENGDAVQAIDTLTNKVTATIAVGQLPQAVVYVPDAVASGPGTANLVTLGQAAEALHLALVPPAAAGNGAHASVVVNALGLVDNLQIAASGLVPGKEYQLSLVESRTAPYGSRLVLAKLKANPSGAGIAQALGPIRQVVDSTQRAAKATPPQYLVLTLINSDVPVLMQQSGD